MAGPLERFGDNLFRVAEAVDGGGIDPVDAEVEGAMDGVYGVVVVLRAPGELPIPSPGSNVPSPFKSIQIGTSYIGPSGVCTNRF